MPAPGQFILNKQVIPSELRSREWEAARVDYWRMERAFVMAGKVRFEDAQACRNAAAALANGKVSLIEARRAVREELERAGYRPTPGTAGTIKDIYTPRRLDVTLKTNVNMARGYAEKNRLTGNAMYPASELHRNRQSREPRDWQTRWNEAAAAVNYEGVARDGSFIALNDSPIWAALSRWRTPYPPFDYGSGMWWRPVKWRVAEKKGLVTDEDMARIESQRPESFNHDVALDTNIRDEDLGAALAEQMKGIAEWDGSSLRLVDRNGTRPYDGHLSLQDMIDRVRQMAAAQQDLDEDLDKSDTPATGLTWDMEASQSPPAPTVGPEGKMVWASAPAIPPIYALQVALDWDDDFSNVVGSRMREVAFLMDGAKIGQIPGDNNGWKTLGQTSGEVWVNCIVNKEGAFVSAGVSAQQGPIDIYPPLTAKEGEKEQYSYSFHVATIKDKQVIQHMLGDIQLPIKVASTYPDGPAE